MRKTTYSFHDPERPLRVHTVRGIFIIFSSGGALAAWGRRPRSTPLRRAAEGRQARGRREARSRVRPCGTFCHHRGRAADSGGPPAQRRASARNHRKARGAWIRCRPRARNPTCGQRAPSWAANSAISDQSTNRRIDEKSTSIVRWSRIPGTGTLSQRFKVRFKKIRKSRKEQPSPRIREQPQPFLYPLEHVECVSGPQTLWFHLVPRFHGPVPPRFPRVRRRASAK